MEVGAAPGLPWGGHTTLDTAGRNMVVTRGDAYQFSAHGERPYRENTLTKAGLAARDLHREKVSPGERESMGKICHRERMRSISMAMSGELRN